MQTGDPRGTRRTAKPPGGAAARKRGRRRRRPERGRERLEHREEGSRQASAQVHCRNATARGDRGRKVPQVAPGTGSPQRAITGATAERPTPTITREQEKTDGAASHGEQGRRWNTHQAQQAGGPTIPRRAGMRGAAPGSKQKKIILHGRELASAGAAGASLETLLILTLLIMILSKA